ncbi:hypothetical protein TSMEX_008906 [Taenia solium]|eukprot:TsM_000673200 transcript=TsM_000673200 gene=TsM_000673200
MIAGGVVWGLNFDAVGRCVSEVNAESGRGGTLLLVALLSVCTWSETFPAPVDNYFVAFSTDSTVELATTARLTNAQQHGKQLCVQAIDNCVLSCPPSPTSNRPALNGASTYTVGFGSNFYCPPPTPPLQQHCSLTLGLHIVGRNASDSGAREGGCVCATAEERHTRNEVKVNMAVPVCKDAYVNVVGVAVPAGGLVAKLTSGLSAVLQGALKGLVAILP